MIAKKSHISPGSTVSHEVMGALSPLLLAAVHAAHAGAAGCDCSSQYVCNQCPVSAVVESMAIAPTAADGDDALLLLLTHATESLGRQAVGKAGRAIVAAGGAVAIATAMERFPQDVVLQRSGCDVLGNLAEASAAGQAAVGEAGGVARVVAAMLQFADDRSVQDHGTLALGSLALGSAPNQEAIVEAGGCSVVASAMRGFEDSSLLQHVGCLTLGHLASGGPAARASVIAAGGAGAATEAMMTFSTDRAVQDHCCYMLYALLGGAEPGAGAEAAVAAGTIRAAGGHNLAALAAQTHDTLHVQRCQQLLHGLATVADRDEV